MKLYGAFWYPVCRTADFAYSSLDNLVLAEASKPRQAGAWNWGFVRLQHAKGKLEPYAFPRSVAAS